MKRKILILFTFSLMTFLLIGCVPLTIQQDDNQKVKENNNKEIENTTNNNRINIGKSTNLLVDTYYIERDTSILLENGNRIDNVKGINILPDTNLTIFYLKDDTDIATYMRWTEIKE